MPSDMSQAESHCSSMPTSAALANCTGCAEAVEFVLQIALYSSRLSSFPL